jgi:hypothetical protein
MNRPDPLNGSGKLLPCCVCLKTFYVTPSRLKKNSFHSCSTECRAKQTSINHCKKIKTNCRFCNKDLFLKNSTFKKIKNPTCSRDCSSKLKSILYSGKDNPKYLTLTRTERIFNDRCQNCSLRAKNKNIDFD